MNWGRVYTWTLGDHEGGCNGYITLAQMPLQHLETCGRLWGRYVRVRNAGAVNELDAVSGTLVAVPFGDAQANAEGDFLFEPGRGGGRIDKVALVKPHYRVRSIEAAHFGEVNTYFHLDRMATYLDSLLSELGEPPLPQVTAVVNAHHAATEKDGIRDGVWRSGRWLPFQGGHYRLPSRRFDLPEYEPISAQGEIHLGPGWQLLEHGALVEVTGRAYRANASHNAGILYHEYGHHLSRYTADFRVNRLRSPERQDNRKSAIDEGTCDYWAATMLGTPHIWCWHRRHDAHETHPRSLLSAKTMADYDAGPGADPHSNGTIWGAALWDLRKQLWAVEADGVRRCDLLVLKTLLLLGRLLDDEPKEALSKVRRIRGSFAVGLAALLQADELLYAGRQRALILAAFSRRGIQADQGVDKVGMVGAGDGGRPRGSPLRE